MAIDLSHEAEIVRMFLVTYQNNQVGQPAPELSLLRALDAVGRLLSAARKEAT